MGTQLKQVQGVLPQPHSTQTVSDTSTTTTTAAAPRAFDQATRTDRINNNGNINSGTT
jgi:hypothetical protein